MQAAQLETIPSECGVTRGKWRLEPLGLGVCCQPAAVVEADVGQGGAVFLLGRVEAGEDPFRGLT